MNTTNVISYETIPVDPNTTYCNIVSTRPSYSYIYTNVTASQFSADAYEKAVNEVYKLGYITKEEADKLKTESYVRRNDCTLIIVENLIWTIIIRCLENTGSKQNILFEVSYEKLTGNVDDETPWVN